jgi:hypothetical protein
MLDNEKIKKELDSLWTRYQLILDNKDSSWEELNEARAILFLIGQVYCEQIAPKAIERRLHDIKTNFTLPEFLNLVDKNSPELAKQRENETFRKLEEFYKIIKENKNKSVGGKYYLDEERFIQKYNESNPNKDKKIDYRGKFTKGLVTLMVLILFFIL